MRILVTGGRGFVGAHLTEELEAHGHDVISVDREDADLSLSGMAALLVKLHSPDYVVHLAARYGRLLCRDEPHRAVSDNAAATTELAAACADRGTPVLYASSSEIYGDQGEDTITEDSDLRVPTTIYGLSKRWGEEALRLYLPPEQLLIVRLNMLYGPKQRAGYGCCSLATFIHNAQRGEQFTVHRGTSRSWLYIEDAVRALRMLIEGGHTGTYNLANDTDKQSMLDVAEVVLRECGGLYETTDPPPGQIAHKNYSIEKLRSILPDWQPEVLLSDGIGLTASANFPIDILPSPS